MASKRSSSPSGPRKEQGARPETADVRWGDEMFGGEGNRARGAGNGAVEGHEASSVVGPATLNRSTH